VLQRLSHPPKPTKIVLNPSTKKTPPRHVDEPPPMVVDKAAEAVYTFWGKQWANKYGDIPRFDAEQLAAARRLVLRHWEDGMEVVKNEITLAFEGSGAPLLTRF
jgi:hypothetical protein